MTSERAASRRRYSREFKAEVMVQCDVPGASVARVAMSHGINANVVHGWRQLAREGQALAPKGGEFISLPLMAPAVDASMPADIRIELRRGPITMSVTWPLSAAEDFAAWSRELLR